MTYQIINYSTMQAPQSLDEFDVNILDLTNENIWCYDGQQPVSINGIQDFASLQKMVEYSKKTVLVVALPQNVDFYYHKHAVSSRYEYDHIKMKDNLGGLREVILPCILPRGLYMPELIYENTRTPIDEKKYNAAFYFNTNKNVLSKSIKSQKATTIKENDRLYITTLNITESKEKIEVFLNGIVSIKNKNEAPDWMKNIIFGDDEIQRSLIQSKEEEIEQAKIIIERADACLRENMVYKSILYTNGEELVEVVYKILEKLLDYDLSGFVDEKKEDFLIKKPEYTIIGEIKGISTNVKNDNVSQLDNHYQQYLDSLQESGTEENVHQILIINPLRTKPLHEREPVHENQIKLARRNGSLIIETKTLLRLFEEFLQERITIEECEQLFTTKIGLLEEKDFKQQD